MRSIRTNSQYSVSISKQIYKAWLVAVLVNSLYSFYWDVAKDWDLTLFSPRRERESLDHAFGLRRRLMVGGPALYYLVIAVDLMLRCTWSLKLSPHLDHIVDFEYSIFMIEFLEVFRRWVWIFFRVETEWLRNNAVNTGMAVDDILLPPRDTDRLSRKARQEADLAKEARALDDDTPAAAAAPAADAAPVRPARERVSLPALVTLAAAGAVVGGLWGRRRR